MNDKVVLSQEEAMQVQRALSSATDIIMRHIYGSQWASDVLSEINEAQTLIARRALVEPVAKA